MELNIQITKFSTEIKPVIRDDQIKAFVVWIFHTDLGIIKIYGGTIRKKQFGKNQKLLLTYEPPSVGRNYTKVFFIDNKEVYKQLCDFTIKEYCQITGELGNHEMNEEVDVDKILL